MNMANEVKTAKRLGLLTKKGLPVLDIKYVKSQMGNAFKHKKGIKLENIVLPEWLYKANIAHPCNTNLAAYFLVNYFQKILEPDLKLEDILLKKVYVSGFSKELTEEIGCWALFPKRGIGIAGYLKPGTNKSYVFKGTVYSNNKSEIENYLKILGEA
jgi:hypothetical protein